MKTQILFTLLLVNLHAKISGAQSLETIDFKMVQKLAKKIGEELWNAGEAITKRSEVQEERKNCFVTSSLYLGEEDMNEGVGASVLVNGCVRSGGKLLHVSFSQARDVNKSGTRLVDEIAKDIKAMLDVRIGAVKRIVKEAEKLPKIHESENATYFTNYTFVNTRDRDEFRKVLIKIKKFHDNELEKLSQQENYTKSKPANFNNRFCVDNRDGDDEGPDYGCLAKFNETINVKSKEASVFFPLDVFDKDGNITRIIHRTKGIDHAFQENYKTDPSIGWQYFCNSTGLFRHFPATTWEFFPINNYDCRLRPWFTGAAASSKDVMILVEGSGSMEGERIIIARDVVRYILDTLTPNDFVNVMQFNDTFKYYLECANHSLIRATSPNIYDLKQALDSYETRGQTDLAEALWEAFKKLEDHKKTSANCNQVIFLITDGMEYNETIQRIFKEENWDKGNYVRVFSFLIGDQIPENDFEQVKLMACENRGFYAQIDTLTETREQAIKYLPIMARPLAHSLQNPITWSNLYVDILDSGRITNHDWDCIQREVQRERIIKYKSEYDWYPCQEQSEAEDWDPEFRKYVFMITVSMPAFERGVNASLMGVAAIDVPLYEFERLFQSYRLGVGGYAFIIDNNGNIITHPDFRPFFQGKVIKPSYDAVDIAEVELMNDGYDARDFSPFLLEFRQSLIDKPSGSQFMQALQPYDDMRRVIRLKRNYFYKRIGAAASTIPYVVVVTYPELFIGRIDISNQIDRIDSMMTKGSNLAKHFRDNFRIHPDWIYCRGIRKNYEDMKLGLIDPDNCEMTPEEELVFYLEKFEKSGWKWTQDKLDSNETRCDRKLMQMLIFDAIATENYPQELKKSFVDKFYIKNSFISTHSGLLRYKIFDKAINSDNKFGDKMKKAIDEVWYKHAVEFNKDEPKSFVYSVPFKAYQESAPLITATHTLFIQKVPIAVVGFQFEHTKLEEIVAQNCPRDKVEQCYILDDNAYILSDPEAEHVGKFFGSVEKKLMQILIEDSVYEPVTIFDYQAVCYDDRMIKYEEMMKVVSNSALRIVLWNPLKFISALVATLISTVYALPPYIANLMYPDEQHFYDEDINKDLYCPNIHEKLFLECLEKKELKTNDTHDPRYLDCLEKKQGRYTKCNEENGTRFILARHINRTRPFKCDKSNVVYSLTKDESNFRKPYDECNRPFVVQKIAHSNLILLVTNRNCAQVSATEYKFNDVPQTIEYLDDSTFCHKFNKTQLFRSRPKSCMAHHDKEPKFDPKNEDRSQCGRGSKLHVHNLIITICILLTLLKTFTIA